MPFARAWLTSCSATPCSSNAGTTGSPCAAAATSSIVSVMVCLLSDFRPASSTVQPTVPPPFVMLTSVEVRGKWVLSVEDWAEIRRLHRAERMPVKVIARVLGCSKNTVRKALAADQPPAYRRRPRGSVVDAVEPRIRELLQTCPTMPATVVAERLEWRYSIRTLSTRVAELRPIYLPPDPASRTTYLAGEIAQCDFWFPPITVPVGFGQTRTATQLPVLTMITGYARWASGLLVPTRRAEDLYAGWWRLIEQLGAVPRVLG